MITLITGAPGAGKTAALVSMLDELSKDRPVFVSGIPGLQVDHVPLEKPEIWPDSVPDGAVVVIDEVQRVWRPRGPGRAVPESVAALETHRHRGLDFYIITQAPNLLDSAVRGLVGRHIHLRDLGVIGRWWYEWPESCDNCRTAWKTAPVKKRYRLPRRVFGSYKSASVHVKPQRSFPLMLAVLVAAVVAFAFFGYRVVTKISDGAKGGAAVASADKPVTLPVPSSAAAPAVPATRSAVTLGPPDERVDFVPRIGGRPWTAPAFDGVRQVVRMPHVAGAICTDQRCVCVSDAGERLDMSDASCREWLNLPGFNPYREPPKPVASSRADIGAARSPAAAPETAPAPVASSVSVPAPSGVSNPRADALLPSTLPPGSPMHPAPPMGVLSPRAQGLL